MLHAALSREILACFYCVYNDLGFGFLEGTYRNALSVEFRSRGFDVQHEVPIEVVYRGVPVGRYRLDLVVNNLVLVETKATRCLTDADERQLLNYLKASPNELGLLLHFGPRPAFRRLIYTNDRK